MGIMALIMPFGGGKNNSMEAVARRNRKSMILGPCVDNEHWEKKVIEKGSKGPGGARPKGRAISC